MPVHRSNKLQKWRRKKASWGKRQTYWEDWALGQFPLFVCRQRASSYSFSKGFTDPSRAIH